jgi:acyl-CoA thioesterase-1
MSASAASQRGSAAVLCGVGLLSVVLLTVACGREVEDRAAAAPATSAAPAASPTPAIVFLGTSLTAGYGLEESDAYPALIQRKIDSAGLGYRVVNAGVSGETSAGGLRRIDWLLRQPVAVLVLELGANDGLRGQDVEAMRANLQAIIDRTRAAHPDARLVIAGMESPPNMGPMYTDAFRAVFPELARANDAVLIPFLLDGVAAVPELNQADGIHPTAEGQRMVADLVWRHLEPVLREEDGRGR